MGRSVGRGRFSLRFSARHAEEPFVKTIVHVNRRAAPPPARVSTLRLGVIVSAFAAVAAVVVRTFTDVPTVAILIAVVVIGFTLSWQATGRHDEAQPP